MESIATSGIPIRKPQHHRGNGDSNEGHLSADWSRLFEPRLDESSVFESPEIRRKDPTKNRLLLVLAHGLFGSTEDFASIPKQAASPV